jgi:plastocyanin
VGRHLPYRLTLLLFLYCAAACAASYGETVDAFVQVRVTRQGKQTAQPAGSSGVVVWLTPLAHATENSGSTSKAVHYRLLQKDKQFTPHLLVIPTGSSVEFPNVDPFFHNVFSQFNGKRFDLGLYESGSSRAVRFDHDGVSYIFCNIHPEMSAVIVTLSTPYYEVSPADGSVTLHGVPPAAYEMHVWAEGSNAHDLNALSRRVVIGPSQKNLGAVEVTIDSHLPPHKNKFGEDYQAPDDSLY